MTSEAQNRPYKSVGTSSYEGGLPRASVIPHGDGSTQVNLRYEETDDSLCFLGSSGLRRSQRNMQNLGTCPFKLRDEGRYIDHQAECPIRAIRWSEAVPEPDRKRAVFRESVRANYLLASAEGGARHSTSAISQIDLGTPPARSGKILPHEHRYISNTAADSGSAYAMAYGEHAKKQVQ